MLLEELCLPVHVTAIENTVTVDLLILKGRCLLRLQVRVSLCPQVVLMCPKIILLRFCLLVEFILMLCVALVESTLKLAQTIRQVAEDVGATDLNEGLVSRLQEYHKLFVHMPEHVVTQYQIDSLPVLSNHTLLVEVDIVALESELVLLLLLHHRRHIEGIVAIEAACDVAALSLYLVPESLQLVYLIFYQKLLHDLGYHIYVVVLIVSLMFFEDYFSEHLLIVILLRAHDNTLHKLSEGLVILHSYYILGRRDLSL